ncbi:MAG: mitochondrial fission ELM1 family protein [Vampirovibrio sp.]|nr:mitochondrial fission ELM1 family protein [Vampirovibrio sp.]
MKTDQKLYPVFINSQNVGHQKTMQGIATAITPIQERHVRLPSLIDEKSKLISEFKKELSKKPEVLTLSLQKILDRAVEILKTKLPDFPKGSTPVYLNYFSWPDQLFTGLALKKIKPESILFSLGTPSRHTNSFDLIAIPPGEKIPPLISKKAFHIDTLPNPVDPELVANAAKKWKDKLIYPSTKSKPIITVLLGGSVPIVDSDNKQTEIVPFTLKHANELCNGVIALAEKLGARLLVSTSLRTPQEVEDAVFKKLAPYADYMFPYSKNRLNPYYGMLGLADFIVVTAESTSQISEALCSGKKTVIYTPKSIIKKKDPIHLDFLNKFLSKGYMSKLESFPLQKTGSNRLENPAQIIAQKVHQLVRQRNRNPENQMVKDIPQKPLKQYWG